MHRDSTDHRQLVLELLTPALHRASMTPEDVDDSLNVIDSGVVDSLGFLDLVASLEQRAGVELDLFDADPDVLTTVGGLAALLQTAPNSTTHSSFAENDR